MRPNRSIIAAVSLAAIATALTAGTELQAKEIPTARNDWRLRCHSGLVIEHFYGTYTEALKAPPCAQKGGVATVWDNGLLAYDMTPTFFLVPNIGLQTDAIAVEPGAGLPVGTATGLTSGYRPQLRDFRQMGIGAKSYDFKGFGCAATGASDAAGAARAPARTCQFGTTTGREPSPR